MTLRVLFRLATYWGLLALVLVVEPHGVYGFGRGWFGPRKGVVAPPESGICASSVLPYGYKCQEIDARVLAYTLQ
ncbi:hypothetical protein TIFTF001_026654 [Ficus carica]|uniref:Secreted protein n=1 Tax=Ficus carica TaxID=3494 RepID=A0AA88IX73_FICCA|nr:hypothetical protein TIFTF001_026654 [Ficus carica]